MKNVAALAREVATHGERGDVVLAHLSPKAALYLTRRYGGSMNRKTGLPSFDFWSKIGHGLGGLIGIGGGGSDSPGNQAYQQLQTEAKPLLDTGAADLAQYNSGQLKPGDAAALTRATTSNKAALKQFYANAGLGSSTMEINQEGAVDQNATVLRQKILDSYLQESLGAYGTAFQPLSEAIGYQFQGAQNSQNAFGSLIGNIFGELGGGGSGGGGLSSILGMFGGVGGDSGGVSV